MGNDLSFIKSDVVEGGKQLLASLARQYLDEKKLENLLVEAGGWVADYERENTEENELRQIVFSAENMRKLAQAMQEIDDFHWLDVLEQNIENLLHENAMSEENKNRCKTHFMEIVSREFQKSFQSKMERVLAWETRDNSVAILGQLEKQNAGLSDLYAILQDRQEEERLNRERQEQGDRASGNRREINVQGRPG